jgi:hypothetical protein
MLLKKEFINKNQTVCALQRNFETLSKLCLSEQEEKQKLISQNRSFNTQLQE